MLINLFGSDPIIFVSVVLALAIALTIHEAAHAILANWLGDPTAKLAGRVSFNPLAHLDPLGTLLLLVVGFGWGKPVPVNSNHFRQPIRDELLVALAGPASNLLLAGLLGIIFRTTAHLLSAPLYDLIIITVFYNISLAIFNLIPLPPLDGSKILPLFVPAHALQTIYNLSLPLLIGLLFILQLKVPIIHSLIFGSAMGLFRLFTGVNF